MVVTFIESLKEIKVSPISLLKKYKSEKNSKCQFLGRISRDHSVSVLSGSLHCSDLWRKIFSSSKRNVIYAVRSCARRERPCVQTGDGRAIGG